MRDQHHLARGLVAVGELLFQHRHGPIGDAIVIFSPGEHLIELGNVSLLRVIDHLAVGDRIKLLTGRPLRPSLCIKEWPLAHRDRPQGALAEDAAAVWLFALPNLVITKSTVTGVPQNAATLSFDLTTIATR